ncbi:MAG: CsgG/HfaB family protein [Prevotellaceae bacterium]|jgi:LEA14-like dessication related protein|nr:CsgG/HfaB family protein [Prevotellaceae bacterium]
MKRFIIFLCLLMLVPKSFLWAQETKLRVAVFDTNVSGKGFDESAGVIIREMVSSALVNTNKYTIIERSLIDKILSEQKFSNSGVVDDSQATELGKLAGANKVILSVLSSASDRGLLSLKMIDVQSASIESQKTKLVRQSEILDVITSLALELIGEQSEQMPAAKEQFTGNAGSGVKTNLPTVVVGNSISLEFSGFKHSKNPNATIYVDDVKIGTGTLNEGFSVSFADNNQVKREVKIEWTETVDTKTFSINTNKKKRFIFEYAKTGFGYAFQLK